MTEATLTPLGVTVLALLREGDMHPYEMLRLLRFRRDDRMVKVTNGTLYHTVSRLKEQGLLDEVGVDREGNRPERTTYTLTEAGDHVVGEWVRRELGRTDHPLRFRVALAEAHNLEREEAIALLTARLDLMRSELGDLDEGLAAARGRGVPEQYILETGRQQALLRADLAWLEEMLPRMSAPGFAWGNDSEHLLAKRKARE